MFSPYYTAFTLTRCDVLAVNAQDDDQLTPLHLASFYAWVEWVQFLLDRGATVNSEDSLGQTPLHIVSQSAYISRRDEVRIGQLLLEHGADVNAQDNNHATSLDLASNHGKFELKWMLKHHGNKANAKVEQGATPNQPELEVGDLHDKAVLSTGT